MKAPLSWLKDYVPIALTKEMLAERLTEVGLGTEKIETIGKDIVFTFEITPNRPDLLSIIGIAREIAAIEKKVVTYPKVSTDFTRLKPKRQLSLTITTDNDINPRFSGVVIANITVKESPQWLKDRLSLMGQRSINNIVDITNYVMFELGNPLHTFDYDEIKGHEMRVCVSKEGDTFTSVDGVSFHLPKGAVIIKDKERIIDLCGIKGGCNSATFEKTQNIFIRAPVEKPNLIRQASQSLGLRSEASSIFERGVNRGGTIQALKRCVDLVLSLAGGEVASELFDIKKEEFLPWKRKVRLKSIDTLLGITIPKKDIVTILSSLQLEPTLGKDDIEVTIPTYRNDLQIEEDLIEEIARLYGYNNFPKTLPSGQVPTSVIPYAKDYRLDERVKELMRGCGFSEVYTYSLISEKDLEEMQKNPDRAIRVDNPVSREYEYLRPSLRSNLFHALRLNAPNAMQVSLFELGKVYEGNSLKEVNEHYVLSGITNSKNYYEVKGILERLFEELGIQKELTKEIAMTDVGVFFELDYTALIEKRREEKIFTPIPKYPPVIEDLAIVASEKVKTIELIETIASQSQLIKEVGLLDAYKETRTFHVIYQDTKRNLTTEDVGKIREKILSKLKEKYHARLKK